VSAGRRPSPLAVLAALIPLLTIAALAVVRPAEAPDLRQAPSDAPLSRSTLVCPAALPGAARLALASAGGTSGELATRVGRTDGTERLADGATTLTERRPVVVTGEGELAPGLLGSRSGGGAATRCLEPRPEQWFTGLGAAAEHSSVLALTNPDRGPAVADVVVLGAEGVMDVPALRGVRVTGGRTTRLDLADVMPTRDALAIGVTVTRGRLGVHVEDDVDPVGGDPARREWLPGQAAPAESSYVAGLGGKPGDRTLTVANPGDSEVRVELRLVTGESEFAPAGLDEVEVDPQSVTEVDLTRVLRGRLARGARALRLDASAPVTAGLRTSVGPDLSLATAGSPVAAQAGAALPPGGKRLVVAGASAPGVLTWQAWDADGRELVEDDRVEVDPGTARRIPVPRAAVRLVVELSRASAVVSVEVGPPGLAVLPLEELVTTSEVPQVRPALR
jgi:hypothetical protein